MEDIGILHLNTTDVSVSYVDCDNVNICDFKNENKNYVAILEINDYEYAEKIIAKYNKKREYDRKSKKSASERPNNRIPDPKMNVIGYIYKN